MRLRERELSYEEMMPLYDEENLDLDSELQGIGERYWDSLLNEEYDYEDEDDDEEDVEDDFQPVQDENSDRDLQIVQTDQNAYFPDSYYQNSIQYTRCQVLSRELKNLYQQTCQICGDRQEMKPGKFFTETHHLQPRSEGGPDIHENMVVVCCFCHKWLDYGSMYIDPQTFKIRFFNDKHFLHGQQAKITHHIRKEYLEYQKEVFKRQLGFY